MTPFLKPAQKIASQLAGRRVLVTGGAGLIGSTIVDALLAGGVAEVRIYDDFSRGTEANLAQALPQPNCTLIRADLRDRRTLEEACEGMDLVFHQAALRITQCAEDPRLAHEVLATGTLNVIEAVVKTGVDRLIAASSASIYGQARQFPTEESEAPYANDTLYGAAKLYLEGMLRSFHAMHQLDYIALRYFNVYGPRMDIYGLYTEVLVRWMERIESGLPPLVFGDGSQKMDFVHVADIAEANLLAAISSQTDRVYNVGTGVETSLLELAEALLVAMDAEDLGVEYRETRKVNAVQRRLASTVAAQSDLGFCTKIGLAEGLRDLVSWWRLQPPSDNVQTAPR